MGLLSIFKRKSAQSPGADKSGAGKGAPRSRPSRAAAAATYTPPPDAAEAVREARARARRRLMGATLLLLGGVIGFPLLFERQPRPIPVDLPIDIPSRNAAVSGDTQTSTAQRPGHASGPNAAAVRPITTAPLASSMTESVTYDTRPASAGERLAPAPRETATTAATAAAATASRVSTAETPHTPASLPFRSAQADASRAPAASAEARATSAALVAAAASRAYALLNTPSPPAAGHAANATTAAATGAEAASDGSRFVVQVGAFADDAKMHEARAKVEKLGLKTYTQSIDTPAGKRVRVRVGPYATRADADKAAGRIKSDGLQAVVLVL